LSNADKGAVGLIPALELASLTLMLWCNTLQSKVWVIWGGVVLRYIALADRKSYFAENKGQ